MARGAAVPIFSDRPLDKDKGPRKRAFFIYRCLELASGGKANDQATDGVDEQELVVDAHPALVAARFGQAVTAIIATIDEMTTLCWRETLTTIPTVLLDDDLFRDMTLDRDAAVAIIVTALRLSHRGRENGCGQKNGDELFHGSFLSCFNEENLRINE
jgi:hypothetical protein